MKKIAILGSTGSIGTQTLQVIENHPDLFCAYVLTAGSNADLLIQQAKRFQPEFVVIADESKYAYVKDALKDLPLKVHAGANAIKDIVSLPAIDIVVTAMVGYAGLEPTIAAIKAHKTIALANKETLVVAGQIIQRLAIDNHAPILPVDSEHSAIFQCLMGENPQDVSHLLITASGGPFRNFTFEQLETVTPEQALKNPNWNMGAKITIDSATMMNKGFEVMEARWLFDIDPQQIEVLVHPQSVIHSMVEFRDGTVKAQLAIPDMRIPIQLALTFPQRLPIDLPRLDLIKYQSLTFETPDTKKFRNLALAFIAIQKKGNMPCIVNAANEVVNAAFRKGKCGFLQMSDIIEKTMERASFIESPDYEDLVASDTEARNIANELL
jgi:1-deoxy-D-xylulose-5-phosphate reductoisomerase